VNFLVVGSDGREEAGGARSDTMFVARVTHQGMEAVWFPRDLLVTVPGHGLQKLNSAYFFGGPQMVVDTLRLNFDLSINHYVELDMRSFRGVVDALGGLRLEFPAQLRDQYTGLAVLAAGCLRIDGAAALALARSRALEQYRDGSWQLLSVAADVSRTHTQQDLVSALAEAVRTKVARDPGSLPHLVDVLLRRVRVDGTLTTRDTIAFARVLLSLDRGRQTLRTLPIREATAPNSQSVLVPADGATALVKTLGGTLPASPGIAVAVPTTPIFTPC
jgi:LCP family protein required for cell wall assembly